VRGRVTDRGGEGEEVGEEIRVGRNGQERSVGGGVGGSQGERGIEKVGVLRGNQKREEKKGRVRGIMSGRCGKRMIEGGGRRGNGG